MRFLKILKQTYAQVLLAVIIGVIFGSFYPQQAQLMKPLGDIFVKLVKMIIAPIIFCTIFTGIISGVGLKEIGKLGIKILIYFEILTTIALIIGLVLAWILKPGVGMNVDITQLNSSALNNYVKEDQNFSLIDFFSNIIPTTIFEAFAKGEILPVLFVAILFAIAILPVKQQCQTIIHMIDELLKVLFRILAIIMKAAPIGAFGAMSYTIAKSGITALLTLMKLMACFYLTCIFFILVVLGSILKIYKSSIIKLIKHIKEELFLVLGTSSSESALPGLIIKMEKFGCPRSIAGFVIPTGYSFNLDGTCIYFTMAIMFIAQACNIDLSLQQILIILFTLLFTAKGAAGVTGSGFITLAATLSVTHTLPVEALVLILGIDRFMSEARAVTNIIGNATAAVVISKIEENKNEKKQI
jgi:aerobic C4-dicarboxylate transport protein